MSDIKNLFLVNHAKENVVCALEQDSQFLFKPAKLTPGRGAINTVGIEWVNYKLPTKSDRYHVYQIGDVSKTTLGGLPVKDNWVSVQDIMNSEFYIIDGYDDKGRQHCKDDIFVMITKSGNLVIAVREIVQIPALDKGTFFIRFYKNAYFSSERSLTTDRYIKTNSAVSFTRTDTITFQQEINNLSAFTSHNLKLFKNGWLVDSFNPDLIALGDKLEYVIDSSIKELITLPVSTLETFTSELDLVRKYLLYRNKVTGNPVDFRDDVDLYVVGDNVNLGVFYHKGSDFSLRMVTHKDYSIPVSGLTTLTNTVPEFNSVDNLTLKLYVRHGGLDQHLINTTSRLLELMELSDSNIQKALTGRLGNVDIWTASKLEANVYPKVMRTVRNTVSGDDVTDLYGYEATVNLVGSVQQLPILINGTKFISIPDGLQVNSTVFEYGLDGELLGFYKNNEGGLYRVKNLTATLCEVFYGTGGNSNGIVYNQNCTLLTTENHKFYYCDIVNGIPLNNWRLGVEREDYIYVNNEITWLLDPVLFSTAVSTSDNFLVRALTVDNRKGYIDYTISSTEEVFITGTDTSNLTEVPLTIPSERLDVFLNGRVLTEGLDFYIDWPRLIITNKEFLNPTGFNQSLVVRVHGFCKDDLQYRYNGEWGWVKNGVISDDSVYGVRNNKNFTLSIGGRVLADNPNYYDESAILLENGIVEGEVYQIRDTLFPVDQYVIQDTFTLRGESEVINQKVSNYLSVYRDNPERISLGAIPKKHVLVSPFVGALNHALQAGLIRPVLEGYAYKDEYVIEMVGPYRELLQFDPLVQPEIQNRITVHPHQFDYITELTRDQYIFLLRAVEIYLADKVDLSNFIKIN